MEVFVGTDDKANVIVRSGDGHYEPVPSDGMKWILRTVVGYDKRVIFLPRFGTDKLTRCAENQGIRLIVVSLLFVPQKVGQRCTEHQLLERVVP